MKSTSFPLVLISCLSTLRVAYGQIPSVRYLGRVNPATKELTWPGTGVAFSFTGSSAMIGLASTKGTNSVELTVDGISTVIDTVLGTGIPTPANLTNGTHTVVLHKRSEANFGSIFISDIATDGALVASTAPTRQIEIVGDSITVGYGLDGVLPCTNTAALEDNPKTYGALAADKLKADYSVVAWSGIGVTRNYPSGNPGPDTSPVMPELYTRYGANDADNSYPFPASWSPQAVVVNLGTNDFAYLSARDPLNITHFTEATLEFVQTIQSHYKNTHIFLMSSPMLSDSYPTAADAQKSTDNGALKNVTTQLNAKAGNVTTAEKVHFVDWPTQGSDVGCDYHPNAATHAAQGEVLAKAISAVLGW